MTKEFVRKAMRESCEPDLVKEYSHAARSIQTAMGVYIDPGELDVDSTRPEIVAQTLDPQRPATIAAMTDAAISLRGYLYKSKFYLREKGITFTDIWKGTPLQRLAERCEEEIEDLTPQLQGRFTHISLDGMARSFEENIIEGAPEHIIATGLNGAGKSTVLQSFKHFTNMIGIKSELTHFPRYNGPLGEMFKSILSGKVKYDPDGFQMLALSDVLNSPPKPDTLMLYDRHPLADIPVFNQKGSVQTTVLAAREILDANLWTIIIDRHPMNTLSEVSKRNTSPRIFEDNREKVLDQYVGFASLTVLPGTIWINNDIPKTENVRGDWQIEMSMRRFFGAIFSSGILQRRLIKQGQTESYENASEYLASSFFKFLELWREGNA